MNKKISINIKYKLLKTLASWVNVPLHSEEARARNRIVKLLQSAYEDFEKYRLSLVDKYGEKDDEGNLKFTEDGSNYLLTDEEQFAEEWNVLKEATVTFPILENRTDWLVVNNILKNITIQMDTATTEQYEELLSAINLI